MIRNIKMAIPSLLTLGNLLCGFLAIASGNHPKTVLLLVLAGATLDLFDGLAARILKATSAFGKQLDSLADLVTFGIAPAIALYHLMEPALSGLLIISLIPLFSAIRLARFNLNGDKEPFFRGLPTPANGIFFASLPLTLMPEQLIQVFLQSERTLMPGLIMMTIAVYAFIILFAWLMVAPLKMFSLKSIFQKKDADPYFVAVLALFIIATALSFGWVVAIPAGVICYILLSVVYHVSVTYRSRKR